MAEFCFFKAFRIKLLHSGVNHKPQDLTSFLPSRDRLVDFLDDVRLDMRRYKVDLVYGVVRWIKPDRETFLP